jgi:hypothetical protein
MPNLERGSRSSAIREYLKNNPKAGPKEVMTALGAQGIHVTRGLISNIKYGTRPTKRGGRRKKIAAAARSRPGSGSEAIRNYLRNNPGAGPKEIQTKLAKAGVRVTLGLISFVKYHKPKRRSKAPSVRAAARRTRTRNRVGSTGITVEQLLEVKRLAESLGDIGRVRKALDTLERLR